MKNTTLALLCAVVFAATCSAAHAGIPDAGQTKCFNNTMEIIWPLQGQDFYGQDAQYTTNPHSYTKLDANGNDLPDNATTWYMVRDNASGLIWQKDTAPGTYTWDAANTYCAGLSLGGHTDWRLPTIFELMCLVDNNIGYPGPVIDTTYFPDTLALFYWSSTNYVFDTSLAWGMGFFDSGVGTSTKAGGNYVRAIRGGVLNNNFIDNGDGTVSDNSTGLMWQQAPAPDTYTWQQALAYCENLILNNDGQWTNGSANASGAKYSDWRMPDRNELQSIADYSRYNPAINNTFFPDVTDFCWSSTSGEYSAIDAWGVDFYYGHVYSPRKTGSHYILSVRAGHVSLASTTTTTVGSTTTVPTTTTAPSTTTSVISSTTTTTGSGSTTTTTSVPRSLCPAKKALGENNPNLDRLRAFRDSKLAQSAIGRKIIQIYYNNTDSINGALDRSPALRAVTRRLLEVIAPMVGKKQ